MYLLFGVHNHQPVGNFEEVFQKATRDCYRPFLEVLYNFPQIKSTIHFSGSLIDWLKEHQPDILQKLKEMVQRNQVELLTGAYYEPILPIIPEEDRIGQIRMLTEFIKDYFEYEPKGMWIGERVWEPYLAGSLLKAGVEYILLDDFHFLNAGIKEDELKGYYLIQEGQRHLPVFPISKKLRYAIPFSLPARSLAQFRNLDFDEAVTIVDDGEKFGLWPGTHRWVYHEKWLEKFFQLLIKNQDWVKTERIGQYLSQHKARGICRLPAGSYEEMNVWSGGSFNNFFAKYPEVNNLHKRMLYVSRKVNAHRGANNEALRHLYMGQCNCPYWHGVFGGVYLAHLRHKAYKNLISAQMLVQEKKGPLGIEAEMMDLNEDGKEEVIIRNPFLQVFIAPGSGGGIFELDFLPRPVNLFDGMSRRPESYHEKIKKELKKTFWQKEKKHFNIHDLLSSREKNLDRYLLYDKYRRISLLDHFLPQDLSLQDFRNNRYQELGDFLRAPYIIEQKSSNQTISVILERQGKVCSVNKKGEGAALKVTKGLSLNKKDPRLYIDYQLTNLSEKKQDIIFAVEFNIAPESPEPDSKLNLKTDQEEKNYSLKKAVSFPGVRHLSIRDVAEGVDCIFYFERQAEIWSYPLETISASERGFERNYQQTVILPCWRLQLEDIWRTRMILEVH